MILERLILISIGSFLGGIGIAAITGAIMILITAYNLKG